MRYETLLLMRNEQQDYSALVRPEAMNEADINALGMVFNATSQEPRLTRDSPALYYFRVGDYALLVRHYTHEYAGKASEVVEGAAIQLGAGAINPAAAAELVAKQAELLNVFGEIGEIRTGDALVSTAHELETVFESAAPFPFIAEFLEQRDAVRLFLPFTTEGRETLAAILADRRFETPPYFAFGTNSTVLAALEKLSNIDIVSFLRTERTSLRDRKTNQVSKYLDEGSDQLDYPTIRAKIPERYAQPPASRDDADQYEDTRVGSQAMPIQSLRRSDSRAEAAHAEDEYHPDDTLLAMQQMPPNGQNDAGNPFRRVTQKLSSLLTPRKAK